MSRSILSIVFILTLFLPPAPSQVFAGQQDERPVDANSSRVTVIGCLRGRNLVAVDPTGVEPVTSSVEPGRRFRLNGPKTIMKDLEKHDRAAVSITGLVRKNTLDSSSQGMPIGAGGRIRIGGTPMNQDPTKVDAGRDPLASVDVLDVESFRPANESCPRG